MGLVYIRFTTMLPAVGARCTLKFWLSVSLTLPPDYYSGYSGSIRCSPALELFFESSSLFEFSRTYKSDRFLYVGKFTLFSSETFDILRLFLSSGLMLFARRRLRLNSSTSITSGSKSLFLNMTKLKREMRMAKLDTTRETMTSGCA